MTAEVCLTPELIHQHELQSKLVVVIDIFRATSCMVTGLSSGVKAIYPVETVEECLKLGAKGMIMAGERGGQKLADFDIGNSPYEYMQDSVKGKDVAVSTTNGTLTLKKSMDAKEILVASFLNITSTAKYLKEQKLDAVLHCAGWKGTPNVEDTLFAGALLNELDVALTGDSALLAHHFYKCNKQDLLAVAQSSGHAHRLAAFGVTKDIEFCVTRDVYDGVIKLEGDHLIKI